MSGDSALYRPRRLWADLVGVWQDTRLIVVTAQIAAIYAAILIPFKAGIPIIPGFVELRPANAIPIVTSLLFGPAAAWGAGIGNIIGDCFGTLGPASVFGFLGNFLLGYLPYFMWGHMGWLSSGQPPMVKSWRQGWEYGLICVVASGACAGMIGWGVELLGLLPFVVLAPAIFFNNIVMGLLLGPPLLGFLYPRVQRWHLRYEDIRPCHVPLEVSGVSHERSSVEPGFQCAASDPHAPKALLNCQNLSFVYSTHTIPALRNISFSMASGEFVMLLGRSGSGKSSLCYACNGLIPSMIPGTFSGAMQVSREDTRALPVWKRADQVGLVFQDFETQLIGTTVGAELRHPLEHRELPLTVQDMDRRLDHALGSVGLNGCLDRDPMRMSGGQRQRLVMASVLVREPQLLVLDDPGSDLDPTARLQLRQTLRRLREEGLSVLMTEQDYDDLHLADRILLLDEGKLVWEGPPTILLRNPSLMRQRGIKPLALTECFEDLGCESLPITMEEAWECVEKLELTIDPSEDVFEDSRRLGGAVSSTDVATAPIIQIDGVGFHYEEHPVLQDIHCAIYPGEFLALLGANGSGKSTLARLLNGLLTPTQGRIVVDGLDTQITSMSELVSRIGLVFQNPDHQIFADTVEEEVAFGARNLGCPPDEIVIRVRESLLAVGLPVDQSGGFDPFSLRKGERQRVAVASILATRPEVLIFDEPTTGLDAQETDRMMAMIRELHRQGHTIVMITHSMRLVAEYAQRCVLMKEGKVVGDGSPREIFGDAALVRSASLELPPICRFSQRWGHTFINCQ